RSGSIDPSVEPSSITSASWGDAATMRSTVVWIFCPSLNAKVAMRTFADGFASADDAAGDGLVLSSARVMARVPEGVTRGASKDRLGWPGRAARAPAPPPRGEPLRAAALRLVDLRARAFSRPSRPRTVP